MYNLLKVCEWCVGPYRNPFALYPPTDKMERILWLIDCIIRSPIPDVSYKDHGHYIMTSVGDIDELLGHIDRAIKNITRKAEMVKDNLPNTPMEVSLMEFIGLGAKYSDGYIDTIYSLLYKVQTLTNLLKAIPPTESYLYMTNWRGLLDLLVDLLDLLLQRNLTDTL